MNRRFERLAFASLAVGMLAFGGCDHAEDLPAFSYEVPPVADDSAARYYGKLELLGSVEVDDSVSPPIERWTFDPGTPSNPLPASAGFGDDSVPRIGRGPACIDGSPYNVIAQRGPDGGPNGIVLELGGGRGICFANGEAITDCLVDFAGVERTLPAAGASNFISNNPAANPFTYNWDRVYLPLCDYSLYAGDTNLSPIPGTSGFEERYYRGNQNFTAGVMVAKAINPDPEKVLISGTLAGGFAAIINLPIVRTAFPDADIFVYSDSGQLIASRDEDRGFLQEVVDGYNATYLLPDSCGDDCLSDGTLFPAAAAFLNDARGEQEIRFAMATSIENVVLGTLFLNYSSPEAYGEEFLRAFSVMESSVQPSEFAGFLLDSDDGDLAEAADTRNIDNKLDVTVEGTTLLKWITDFLSLNPNWDTVSEVVLPE